MKFLDLNGLKHLLKRLVSYDSSNGIAVKRIEGKPEPGKNNSTLVLGSGRDSFPVYYSEQDVESITRSSILIGKKLRDSEDSSENNGIKILSNEDIINASPNEFKISAGSNVDINAYTSIHTKSSSVFMDAESGINLTANDKLDCTAGNSSSGFSAFIASSNGASMFGPSIYIYQEKKKENYSIRYLCIKSTDEGHVYLGGDSDNPMIALRRSVPGGVPKEIRFKVNSNISARFTDNENGTGGFYIFTNLYAKTDHSTDLPANITPTVKEALDTKSVQCLLAELLMKTGLY